MLAPEFQPITFSVGFLESPLIEVMDGLRDWYSEQGAKREIGSTHSNFPGILASLEPLSAPFFKRLWIATTSSRWRTGYFDGFINGGDPGPPISYLAERLGVHGLVLTCQPDSKKCYGATKLELYGPDKTDWLNRVWSVAAVNDGGRWTWHRAGAEQPFEELEAYAARKIRDRLTPDRLERYARALSVPLDSAEFRPEAFLDIPAGIESTTRRETLAVARERFGLVPTSP